MKRKHIISLLLISLFFVLSLTNLSQNGFSLSANDVNYTFENDNLFESTDIDFGDSYNVRKESLFSGHYPATYSFEGETGLEFLDIGFVDYISSINVIEIISDYESHDEVLLFGADYYAHSIPQNIGSWFVWDKRGDDSADKMFGSCFELCWSKKKHKRDIIRIKWAGIFGMEKEHDKKRKHPTQKPVALILWFFEKFKGENIVDLYGGSGSTLLAAEKTNKKTFLMELDPKYCDVIIQRWCEYTGINEIKINDKKVNWIEQTKF